MSYTQHVDPKSLLKRAVKNSHFKKNFDQYEKKMKHANREIQHLKRKFNQLKAEFDLCDDENEQLSHELSSAYGTIDSMNDLCGTEESLKNRVKDLKRVIRALKNSIVRLEERKRHLQRNIDDTQQ